MIMNFFSQNKLLLNTNLICSSMHRPCPRLGCAHISVRNILVSTSRKLTAADHSTPITEYDLSLHALTKQYVAFQTANSKNFKFFQKHKKVPSIYWFKYIYYYYMIMNLFSQNKLLNTNLICSSMYRPCPRLDCAHISFRNILVSTSRKLTATDHSTPITEYDLSLRCLTRQYITFQNAKLEKFHIFLRHTKIP